MGGLGGSLSGPRGGSREPRERCDPKQGHPRKRGEANGGRATGRRERTERVLKSSMKYQIEVIKIYRFFCVFLVGAIVEESIRVYIE